MPMIVNRIRQSELLALGREDQHSTAHASRARASPKFQLRFDFVVSGAPAVQPEGLTSVWNADSEGPRRITMDGGTLARLAGESPATSVHSVKPQTSAGISVQRRKP